MGSTAWPTVTCRSEMIPSIGLRTAERVLVVSASPVLVFAMSLASTPSVLSFAAAASTRRRARARSVAATVPSTISRRSAASLRTVARFRSASAARSSVRVRRPRASSSRMRARLRSARPRSARAVASSARAWSRSTQPAALSTAAVPRLLMPPPRLVVGFGDASPRRQPPRTPRAPRRAPSTRSRRAASPPRPDRRGRAAPRVRRRQPRRHVGDARVGQLDVTRQLKRHGHRALLDRRRL